MEDLISIVILSARKSAAVNDRSAKRQIDLHGYCADIGFDGPPIDPNHPFNRAG